MTKYKIDKVDEIRPDGKSYEVIDECSGPLPYPWIAEPEVIIERIFDGDEFVTIDPLTGREQKVQVYQFNNNKEKKFIRTNEDRSRNNNLDNLPEITLSRRSIAKRLK